MKKANSVLSVLRRVLIPAAVIVIAVIGGCVEEVVIPPPPPDPPPAVIKSVTVVPETTTVLVQSQYQFRDSVTGSGNFSKEVRWSAAVGNITQSGLYRAPMEAVVDTVYARSVADTTKAGKALVYVVIGINSVDITPSVVSVEEYGTVQFTATVSGLPGANTFVRWSARRGTVNGNGLYTAPATSGPDQVRVVSIADTTKFAVASVNVTPLTAPKLLWVKFRNFGKMRDRATAVAVDMQNNNLVVVGAKGLESASTVKGTAAGFDTGGRELWALEFAGPSYFSALVPDASGTTVFLTGDELYYNTKTLYGALGMNGAVVVDPVSSAIDGPGAPAITRGGNRLYIGEFRGRVVIMDAGGGVVETFIAKDKSRIFGLWAASDHLLVSGDFYDASGNTNVASFIRKFDAEKNLLWERIYDDVLSLHVVEDAGETIFVAGTFIKVGGQFMLVAALDRDGNKLWEVKWDGDQAGSYANWVKNLILNPSGGVVAVGAIQEFPGNPKCSTFPNCWDFGLWAVGPSGETKWALRQGFGQSPWDVAWGAAFDRDGNLVVVGESTPNPTGRDFTDNVDWIVSKFAVPRR